MSEQPLSVTVHDTPTVTITRRHYATGAVTIYRERLPPPEVTLPPRPVCETGAAEVARREANAATNQDAEDLTTEWDRYWGS